MRFEHLLPVNPPKAPDTSVSLLTRWGLWRGLWQRVERPELFLPGLAEAKILSRMENLIVRELVFGTARVLDRVTFKPGAWLCFSTEPEGGRAGGSLAISLEEGEAMPLSLRFVYATTFDASGENAPYAAYLEEVYRDSDEETLAVIRRLLAEEEKSGSALFCPSATRGGGNKLS